MPALSLVTTDRMIFCRERSIKQLSWHCRAKCPKNISSCHISYDMSTMGSRQRRIVIALSWVSRKSVVRQSYDNRQLFWANFQVFMSWDARVTVVSLSYHSVLKHARIHPHEPNEITGRFPLQLLHQCILYCPKIRRRSINGLTHQRRSFRWFLYCSRARINANMIIFCSCWSPARRLFSRSR